MEKQNKIKIALVDVQNTESTTKQLLGFLVDWKRLYEFLKNDWKCEKVILYSGIDEGDLEKTKEFEILEKDGCLVRVKTVFAYKNKDKNIKVKCPKCENEFVEIVSMGYNKKSNCMDRDITPQDFLKN